jgi:hypothetical protein
VDGAFRRLQSFFHRHPILLLLAFTPGIPEYLSGSSPVATLAVNPFAFLVFLGLNLGLYGGGVLLAREAWVRWRPGWAGMLLIGSAYGLLEEGTALSTLFNPHAAVVQSLGSYGHFAGVNWVWLVGLLGVHTVYSVGLPILLLGLALPETRGRPLLGPRGITLAAIVYGADIGVLVLVSGYYRVAPGLLLAAALAAGLLYLAAWRLPKGTLDPPPGPPRRSGSWFFALAAASFPVELILQGIAESARAPAALTVLLVAAAEGALFYGIWSSIGSERNERALVLVALGAILPILLIGFIAQVRLPLVLVADAAAMLFFFALLHRYPAPSGPTPVAVGSAPL